MFSCLKKSILLSLLPVVILPFSLSSSFANQERPDHYIAEKPATFKSAKEIYLNSLNNIGSILDKEKLSFEDFEAIHEISYVLEACLSVFGENTLFSPSTLKTLTASVEMLHLASEDNKEELVRKSYAELVKENENFSDQ